MESEIMQINLTEIVNVIWSNVNAWLPTATSVISIIICVFIGFARIKRACNDIRSDTTLKHIDAKIDNDLAENKALHAAMRRYLDENHKIRRGTNNEESGENRS